MVMILLLLLLSCVGAHSSIKSERLMSPTQLIKHRGYPAEEHSVTTADGYILTMHRMPWGKFGLGGGRPVLLQHGLLMSSMDFLVQKTNESISYSLADAGYDVWIGNNRGNIYSDSHVNYSNTDPRFWNFSWDEFSLYDYPAMLNYVLNATSQPNLYLVGHSQGAHTFITATTAHPKIQEKVKHLFALAPSLSNLHIRSGQVQIELAIPEIDEIALGVVPDQLFSLPLLRPVCGTISLLKFICRWVLEDIGGPTDQVVDSQLPLVTEHFPAGTSNKNMLHWLQQASNGTKYFDYGRKGNLAAYGTPYPREFNFSGYSVPTSMYFSAADKLVSARDINIALARLPASAIVKTRNLTGFGHFEFVWGNRAKAQIYDEIIADINAMEERSTGTDQAA